MDPFAESLADRIRQNVRETVGVGDAALTMGKHMATQPVAAWRAMADLLRGRGVKNAVRNAESFQERVAGKPKTIEGGQYLERAGGAIDTLMTPFSAAADAIGERSPVVGGLAMAMGSAVDPTHIKALTKGLRGAKAAQRTLPGIKALGPGERALQEVSDAERGMGDATRAAYEKHYSPNIPIEQGTLFTDIPNYRSGNMGPEGTAMMADATTRVRQAGTGYRGALARLDAEPQWARMDELRGQRSPITPLADDLAREEELLALKLDSPIDAPGGLVQPARYGFDLPEQGREGVSISSLPTAKAEAVNERIGQRRDQRQIVRQLREANAAVNPDPLKATQPAWAQEATLTPLQRGNGPLPADEYWWKEALANPPESVAAFLRAAKDQPEIFTYGGMPENAYSLEDFAQEFGDRAGKRIDIDHEYNEGYSDEPMKIDVEKTHGRHELMRDRYGDYKQEPKEHDTGDYPMYDEYGDVKKTKVGLDDEGDPIKEKRRAEGGEPMRDRYGNEKYSYIKSEGGEPMRDEYGHQKWTKEDNPDYYEDEPVDKLTMSVPGEGRIWVEDWEGDNPMTTATQAGKAGALLYQTLLAHASKSGMQMGVAGLTHDNQLRLLSNTLANAARTGTNPRDVTGTLSGKRPAAKGFAKGDRLWQALAGETDARLANHPEGDPDAIGFTPESFTHRGQPILAQDIHDRIEEFSPGFRGPQGTKVGPKTLMQNAVFKWLENASPEQAEQVAREWPKRFGKPLFSAAGAGIGTATLADLLRQDQEAQD